MVLLQKLKESHELQLYLADAREVESFLNEQLPLTTSEEYGATEDRSQVGALRFIIEAIIILVL